MPWSARSSRPCGVSFQMPVWRSWAAPSPIGNRGLIAPGQIPFEELPAFVSACRVGVAPIFSGSGTRLRFWNTWRRACR